MIYPLDSAIKPLNKCVQAISLCAECLGFEWKGVVMFDQLHVKNSLLRFVTQTRSAYHLYGKPGNSGENSNRTVHPGGNFPEKK